MVELDVLKKAFEMYADNIPDDIIRKICNYVEAFNNNEMQEILDTRISAMEEKFLEYNKIINDLKEEIGILNKRIESINYNGPYDTYKKTPNIGEIWSESENKKWILSDRTKIAQDTKTLYPQTWMDNPFEPFKTK
jgi:hypothetical protein